MKAWLVRFVSLWAFNVLVLLLVGMLYRSVEVGWAALWGSVILTAATIWVKPAVHAAFTGVAAKSAHRRTKVGEKVLQFALVLAVQLVVWLLVVWLSGVSVSGVFWWWFGPPLFLWIAWIIYDAVDDKIEARTGALYDRATGGRRAKDAGAVTPPASTPSPGETVGRREMTDGLTEEQRRMLDELGKG